MRFMIIVKATQAEAGVMPKETLFAEMSGCHEKLAQAGMLSCLWLAAEFQGLAHRLQRVR